MEWYGWVAWGLSISTGVYGAWRAEMTARRVRRLTAPWVVTPVGPLRHGHVLRSQLPYTARGVTVEPAEEKQVIVRGWDNAVDIPATEAREVYVFETYQSRTSDIVVRWQTPFGRERSSRLTVPPSPYEPFKDRR